jgi:hypothetical protein
VNRAPGIDVLIAAGRLRRVLARTDIDASNPVIETR